MRGTEVLSDGFARIPALVRAAVEGANRYELISRLDPDANSLLWLTWHIGREQDLQLAQLAQLAGREQVWVSGDWRARTGLEVADEDVGYGNTSEQVARIDAPADELLAYVDAVGAFAQEVLRGFDDVALDEVVDASWNPPVTRAVRLVSILGDAFEHAGQAAFVRGVLDRAR